MKILALGVLSIGLIAACGGGDKDPPVILTDAPVDAPTVCSPTAQTGCATGEKCTWIIDIDGTATADEVGHTGCAPAGTIAVDATCESATAATGSDTCVAGSLCISGKCKPICERQAQPGSNAVGACGADYVCAPYQGVFSQGGAEAIAGVCEPGCDPLTQRLKVGGAEACNSVDPAMPDATCVRNDSTFTAFGCAPTFAELYELTDREVPFTDPRTGEIFVNSCAPGFVPHYLDQADGSQVLCSGLCAPTDVDADLAAAAKTAGNPNLNAGDPTVAAKLLGESAPAAGNATCLINKKGSVAPDENGNGVEDCTYLWFAILTAERPDPGTSPYNDTLGICFNYNAFKVFDTNDDDEPDAFAKSCKDLPVDAPDTDVFGRAVDNGCYSLAKTREILGSSPLRKRIHRRPLFRLANVAGSAVRHVFD